MKQQLNKIVCVGVLGEHRRYETPCGANTKILDKYENKLSQGQGQTSFKPNHFYGSP